MNERKDSFVKGGGGGKQTKRKSSLGLRSWMTGGPDEHHNHSDAPSCSRQTMQRSNSNVGMQFSSATRIPRFPPPNYTKRRSSSQEPPSYRRQLTLSPGSDLQHMSNVGVLLTPVRSLGQSPNLLNMSTVSSARSSSAFRIKQKLQFSGTVPKMREERPLTDSTFQANCLKKIQAFIRNCGVQVPKLKPLSTAVFISTFNLLIGQLDPALNVNNTNYVELVATILSSFEYPSVISKTSLLAVVSTHATQQLLAMLAWLIDFLEVRSNINPEQFMFPNADMNEEEKVLKSSYKTLFEAYAKFKQGEKMEYDALLEIFCRHTGDSLDYEQQLKSDIEDFTTKLEAVRKDPTREQNEDKILELTKVEDEIKDLSAKKETQLVNEKIMQNKVLQLKEIARQLDVELGRLDDMIVEVQERVETQEMNALERDNIRTQCNSIRENLTEQRLYMEKLQELVGKVDIDMANIRKNVSRISQDINCIVLENRLDESLKWMHNPLDTNTASQYILLKKSNWFDTLQQMKKHLEQQQEDVNAEEIEIAKLTEDLQQKKNQLTIKMDEKRRLGSEIVTIQLQNNEMEQNLYDDIEQETSACFKLQQLLNQKPKLEEVEQCIEAVLREKDAVTEEIERYKDFTNNVFLPKVLEITLKWQEQLAVKMLHVREKYMERINEIRNECLKITEAENMGDVNGM